MAAGHPALAAPVARQDIQDVVLSARLAIRASRAAIASARVVLENAREILDKAKRTHSDRPAVPALSKPLLDPLRAAEAHRLEADRAAGLSIEPDREHVIGGKPRRL